MTDTAPLPADRWYRFPMEADKVAADSLHGWLPAVLPVSAHSFRVGEEGLATLLAEAGAELRPHAPDVEIAAAGGLRGDAAHAVVSVDAAQREGGPMFIRAPRRAACSMRARGKALVASRALEKRGYSPATTVMWDIDDVLHVPGVRAARRDHSLTELLPQRAAVTGSRGRREPTILEAVIAQAGEVVASPLSHGLPLRARPRSWSWPTAGFCTSRSAQGVRRSMHSATRSMPFGMRRPRS